MTRTIAFYFDPISPYSWLSSKTAPALAKRAGVELDAVPVLLAGLLAHHGTKGPAEIPAKRAYVFRDVIRTCALEGYAFKGPPAHPFNPLLALRVCTALEDPTHRLQAAVRYMEAAWERGQNLEDPKVSASIVRDLGLDPVRILDLAQTQPIKDRLRETTERAARSGVFGVPTFILDADELFWGNDRMDQLERRLRGERGADPKLLRAFLARPATAARKPG